MFMGCDRDGVGEVYVLWIVPRDLKVNSLWCVAYGFCGEYM